MHEKEFKSKLGTQAQGINKTNIRTPNAGNIMTQMKMIMKDNTVRKGFFPRLDLNKVFAYYSDSSYPLRKRCVFPWFSTSIKPNGDLSLCFHNYVVGNLKEKRFKSLWNNKKARKFRKTIFKEKYFPACTRCGGILRYP